jgi:hypothetical protein
VGVDGNHIWVFGDGFAVLDERELSEDQIVPLLLELNLSRTNDSLLELALGFVSVGLTFGTFCLASFPRINRTSDQRGGKGSRRINAHYGINSVDFAGGLEVGQLYRDLPILSSQQNRSVEQLRYEL